MEGLSNAQWQVRDAVILAFGSLVSGGIAWLTVVRRHSGGPLRRDAQAAGAAGPLDLRANAERLQPRCARLGRLALRPHLRPCAGRRRRIRASNASRRTVRQPRRRAARRKERLLGARAACHFVDSAWAQTITSLAEVCYESAQTLVQESDTVFTYALSSAFSTIVGKLLQVANRFALLSNAKPGNWRAQTRRAYLQSARCRLRGAHVPDSASCQGNPCRAAHLHLTGSRRTAIPLSRASV